MKDNAICLSAMSVVAQTAKAHGIQGLGINPDDFKLLTGNKVWMSTDKHSVCRTLQSLIGGSMSAQGLPQMDLCAEYLAAIIAMFVAPVNYMAACSYMQGVYLDVDVAVRDDSPSKFSPSRLFGLVLLASSGEYKEYQKLFNKDGKYMIEHAVEKAK